MTKVTTRESSFAKNAQDFGRGLPLSAVLRVTPTKSVKLLSAASIPVQEHASIMRT